MSKNRRLAGETIFTVIALLLFTLALVSCSTGFTLYDAEQACENGAINKYEHRTHREVKRLECTTTSED